MGQATAFPVLGQAQKWKLRPFPVLGLPKSGNSGRVSTFGPAQIPINGNQENNSYDKLIFDNDPSINELIKNHSVKYKSNGIKSENMRDKEIELEHLFSDLEKSIDDDGVPIETCVEGLRKINLEISDTHFNKIKFQEKSKQKESYQALRDNKFWYDKECKNEKKEMNKLRRAYRSALLLNTNDEEISTAKMHYVSGRRIYKKLRRRKEREYWNKKKDELRNFKSYNPKLFWHKLKNKTSKINFSKNELYEYFKISLKRIKFL